MKTVKEILKEKIERMNNQDILESLKEQPIEDIENWGYNPIKLMAEEAEKRGLLRNKK